MFRCEFCGRNHQVADYSFTEFVKRAYAVIPCLSVEVFEERPEGFRRVKVSVIDCGGTLRESPRNLTECVNVFIGEHCAVNLPAVNEDLSSSRTHEAVNPELFCDQT